MKTITFIFLIIISCSYCKAQSEISYKMVYPSNSVHQNIEAHFDNFSSFDLEFKSEDYLNAEKVTITFNTLSSGSPFENYTATVNTGYKHNFEEDRINYYDLFFNTDAYTVLSFTTANLPLCRIYISYYGEEKQISLSNVKIKFY